jgi:hypothetical protein
MSPNLIDWDFHILKAAVSLCAAATLLVRGPEELDQKSREKLLEEMETATKLIEVAITAIGSSSSQPLDKVNRLVLTWQSRN